MEVKDIIIGSDFAGPLVDVAPAASNSTIRDTRALDKVRALPEATRISLITNTVLNLGSDTMVGVNMEKSAANLAWNYGGNKTECGLLRFALELSALDETTASSTITKSAIQKAAGAENTDSPWVNGVVKDIRGGNKIPYGKNKFNYPDGAKLFPFNSEKKKMTIVVKWDDDTYRVITKGGPDVLLGKTVGAERCCCSELDVGDGTTVPFADHAQEILARIPTIQSKGLRTLCIAYKDYSSSELSVLAKEHAALAKAEAEAGDGDAAEKESDADGSALDLSCLREAPLLKDMTFHAVFGIQDPPRAEVPRAVTRCKEAGIVVRMCTGDVVNTALAIAIQCNLLEDEGKWDAGNNPKYDESGKLNTKFDGHVAFARVYKVENGRVDMEKFKELSQKPTFDVNTYDVELVMQGPVEGRPYWPVRHDKAYDRGNPLTWETGSVLKRYEYTSNGTPDMTSELVVDGDGDDLKHLVPTQKWVGMDGLLFRSIVFDFQKNIYRPDNQGKEAGMFDKIWPDLRVLARCQPSDKQILVRGLIESKLYKHKVWRDHLGGFRGTHNDQEVVAVTGDGTNDAPALNTADIGFAMGIQGTDVAKEAADIILNDDDFTAIVKSCMWGRNVYDAIAKFVQFQLTVNVAAVVIAITGAFTIKKSPLTAVQMLWVNLIMDALAALALATEPPTLELLKRKPFGRNKRLLSNKMFRFIFGAAFYQLVVLFVTLYLGPWLFGGWIGVCTSKNARLEELDAFGNATGVFVENSDEWKYGQGHCTDEYKLVSGNTSPELTQHYTIIFNVFVMMQLFQEINARELKDDFCGNFKGIYKNFYFISILVLTLVLQVAFVMIPGINIGLDCYALALTWQQWLLIMALSFGMLIWGMLLRLVNTNLCPKYGTCCGMNPDQEAARPWYLCCCFKASGAGGTAKSAYNIGKVSLAQRDAMSARDE
jgi:magnesium-transporting ATPase (P-type)